MLQLAHLNAWLAKQPALVNRRTKALHPVVRERVTLVGMLRTLLGDTSQPAPSAAPAPDAAASTPPAGAAEEP